MTIDPPNPPAYTTLSMHEFKAKLCDYLRRLNAGEGDYVINRYGRPVAYVLSVYMAGLRADAARAQRELKRYLAMQRRHEEQKRLIRARLHGWPGHKKSHG